MLRLVDLCKLKNLFAVPSGRRIVDGVIFPAFFLRDTQNVRQIGCDQPPIVLQRLLTAWRNTQPAASVKRVIGHWLGVLVDVEADTKTVLNILVSCK